MLYKCTEDYNGKFKGIKGHIYALSESSVYELEIDKIESFTLLTEDEERKHIQENRS